MHPVGLLGEYSSNYKELPTDGVKISGEATIA